jgi:hypothetical protein
MIYIMSESGDSECVICLESLRTDVQVLACSHKLHKTCLQEYKEFNTNSVIQCPLCKQVIVESNPCSVCHVVLAVVCVFGIVCTLVYWCGVFL